MKWTIIMIITRDAIELNPEFPFLIMEQVLYEKDNQEDFFHWHSYCEITYIKKGHGYYYVNGRRYEVHEKDLIIFNNVELHGWQIEDDQMEVVVMIFPAEFVSMPLTMFDNDYLRPFMSRGSNFRNKIGADEENADQIVDIIQDISREWKCAGVGYRLMIKSQILRILTLLIRHYQKCGTGKEESMLLSDKNRSMKRIETALYYINSHYTEKLSLEKAAAVACMSPAYFSTYFKSVTHYGFSEYVTKLRLKKVKELEKTTDLNMFQIAMDCGFSNMSNFYRLNKKYGDSLDDKSTTPLQATGHQACNAAEQRGM